jgi:type II secretory pathway component GspD/PulD (secretin)
VDSKAKQRRGEQRLATALIAVLAFFTGATASAADIPWKTNSRFQYVAKNKNLKELLQEFSASQGIAVVMTEDVDGKVNGRFNTVPQAMLELLAGRHGLLWYYDGAHLHITPSSRLRTEAVALPAEGADQLQAVLSHLGVLDRRYPLHVQKDESTALVSGPARYVELVLHVARSMQHQGMTTGVDLKLDSSLSVRKIDNPAPREAETFTTPSQPAVTPGISTVIAQHADTPIQHWDIHVTDNTLKSAMTRWSKAAGWQLLWELPYDYQIEAGTSIANTFEGAVEAVARSLTDSASPMKAIFYRGNKVLRIVMKEGE